MAENMNIRIGQIVLDEDKVIREKGEEALKDIWARLDVSFADLGARRLNHNFYVSNEGGIAMGVHLICLRRREWFMDYVKTMYWYNPKQGFAEDSLAICTENRRKSADPWNESCVEELSSLI